MFSLEFSFQHAFCNKHSARMFLRHGEVTDVVGGIKPFDVRTAFDSDENALSHFIYAPLCVMQCYPPALLLCL